MLLADHRYGLAAGRCAAVLLFAMMATWTLQQPPTSRAETGQGLVKRVWPNPARLSRIAVVDCGTTIAVLLVVLLIPSGSKQPHASVATVVIGSIILGVFYLVLLAQAWSSAPALAPSLEAKPEQLAAIAPSGQELRHWARPELVSWSISKNRLTLHTANEPIKRPSRLSIRCYERADVEGLLRWFGLPHATDDRREATP
jgi:hypothetical protein